MPPNPRDNLPFDQPVPIWRVREAVADALRPILADPRHRAEAAVLVIAGLQRFRLLASDIEGDSGKVIDAARLLEAGGIVVGNYTLVGDDAIKPWEGP